MVIMSDLSATDFITNLVAPYDQKTLTGRLLRVPPTAPTNHVIVIIYGHHASLERNLGIVWYLRQFGEVIMPDLPGFGGMGSFYQVSLQPTLDNYAAYLDKFLRQHLQPNQTFTLFGFSFGFLVVTRLLQLYPAWRTQIQLLVSLVGFVTAEPMLTARRRFWYKQLTNVLKTPPGAWFFRYVCLNRFVIRHLYSSTFLAKAKFTHLSPAEKKEHLEMEVTLWHQNDVRTWAYTGQIMLTCQLLASDSVQLPVSVFHVGFQGDQYLNNQLNLQQLQRLYPQFEYALVQATAHAPSVVATAEEATAFVPPELLSILKRLQSC